MAGVWRRTTPITHVRLYTTSFQRDCINWIVKKKPIAELTNPNVWLKRNAATLGRNADYGNNIVNSKLPPIQKFSLSKVSNENETLTTKHKNDNDMVSLLQKILNLDNALRAERLLVKYKQLLKVDPEDVKATYIFLEKSGVNSRYLKSNIWILAMDPETMIAKTIALKSQLNINEFLVAIPFFNLPARRLARLASIWTKEILNLESDTNLNPGAKQFANRIEVIANWLNCESLEVSEMMGRTPTLMSAPLPSIKAKLTCMLDNGVTPADIINDPFIFSNQLERIESKLSTCKEHGLQNVKPWLLRCTPYVYKTYLLRTKEESELLDGHEDVRSFLAKSLRCTQDDVSKILLRVPSIRNSTASKLNEMIQFLLEKGFTTNQIVRVPRILGPSVQTVEKRLSEMNVRGFTPKSFVALCYTAPQFLRFLRSLDKKMNKRLKE